MTRIPRINYPTATYHVMLRGNDGQQIFLSDQDRCRMCLLIQEGIERYGHRIHAFCFMKNHIHLAIQLGEIPISKIIHNLASRYANYFNRKYNKIGHLFQGRFKSIVVENQGYLKELIRYIHLNPARCKLVNTPEEYRWSSHKAYLEMDHYVWLSKSFVLEQFSREHSEAVNLFQKFVNRGIGIATPIDFKTGFSQGIIGDDEFIEFINEKITFKEIKKLTLQSLIDLICKEYKISEEKLKEPSKEKIRSEARAMLALLVKETEGVTIEELSLFLKRDSSSLSKLASRWEVKALSFAEVKNTIEGFRKSLR